jgi:hypothetical protein
MASSASGMIQFDPSSIHCILPILSMDGDAENGVDRKPLQPSELPQLAARLYAVSNRTASIVY